MARPKMIEDTELLKLLKQFYENECNGNIKKLNYEAVSNYIRHHGYPEYQATMLRRTKAAREYLDGLRNVANGKNIQMVIAYKTLDVDAFLDTNRSRDSLRSALIALDNHYRTIYDSASIIIKSNNKQTELYNQATENLNLAQNQIKELEATISTLKDELKDLRSKNKALQDVVDTYVYPDIANELLSRDSVIYQEQSTIDGEKLDKNIIDAATEIKNIPAKEDNIINALFNRLEE